MPLYSKIFILIATVLFTFSCSKDDPSADDSSSDGYDFQSLNGTWAGETRILQAGDCISGNPNWTLVEMEVEVDSNGNVEIMVERQFEKQDMMWYVVRTQWMGTVSTNDSIYLTKTQIVDCFGTDVTLDTDFASILVRTGNSIQFSLNALEVFCPDQNCVFDREYVLSK